MSYLLIDGDAVAYRYTVTHDNEVAWEDGLVTRYTYVVDVVDAIQSYFDELLFRFQEDEVLLTFSCPIEQNFRRRLSPRYKASRTADKPAGYWRVVEALTALYRTERWPGVEADDILGVLGTSKALGDCAIVTHDSDMRTVPARVYDLYHDEVHEVTLEEADHAHLVKTVAGDRGDGVDGCPGVGKSKADAVLAQGEEGLIRELCQCPKVGPAQARKLLDDLEDPWDYLQERHPNPAQAGRACSSEWGACVAAFERAGLTEDDALLQARLVRTLRTGEYVKSRGEAKLWTP